MNGIEPITPFNSATVNAIGGLQLATGGGCFVGPAVIKAAGSADCTARLYDGTDASGRQVGEFSLGNTGPVMGASICFAEGLFIEMTGTDPGTLQLIFSGNAAA